MYVHENCCTFICHSHFSFLLFPHFCALSLPATRLFVCVCVHHVLRNANTKKMQFKFEIIKIWNNKMRGKIVHKQQQQMPNILKWIRITSKQNCGKPIRYITPPHSLAITGTSWRRLSSVEAFRRRPNHELTQEQQQQQTAEPLQVHNYQKKNGNANNKAAGNRSSIITVENLETDDEQQWKRGDAPLSATTTMTTLHIWEGESQ